MAKKMLTKEINGKKYEIRVDQEHMMFKSNRMEAFSMVSRNYNGNKIYCQSLSEMKWWWEALSNHYDIVDEPVAAPKVSLFTIGDLIVNGKQTTGRKVYSKQKSYLIWQYKVANNNFKGLTGEALRNAIEIMEKAVKEEMKVWEANFLANLQ